MKNWLFRCVFLVFVSAALLSGCGTWSSNDRDIYSWGSYEKQIYSYLDGENRDSLLLQFQRELEVIKSSNKKAPPGFFAHLGLLYAETGQEAEAFSCFIIEKSLFPEAAPFMDFLLRRQKE